MELFGELGNWDTTIFAARTNPSTRKRQRRHPGFCLIPVTGYSSNGIARVLNWFSFAAGVLAVGVMIGARRRPAMVYASSPHLLTGVVGVLLARTFRVPFVFEVRDLWPQVLVSMGQLTESSLLYRVLKAIENQLYTRAAKIVVLAEGVKNELVQRGVPADKIELIPNAADSDFFAKGSPRDVARAEHGFTRFTGIYAGAHGPANGLDLVLDAATTLRDLGRNDVEIVLVGDGVEKERLVRVAEARSLRNVRFLPPVPKSEMPDLLRAADVGLHCLSDVPLFRYGVSPNKVFDYMAAGLPVLTNTPGEVAALVEEARAGSAVSPTDLAEGLIAMADAGPDRLEAWGAAGFRYTAQTRSRAVMRGVAQRLLAATAQKAETAS